MPLSGYSYPIHLVLFCILYSNICDWTYAKKKNGQTTHTQSIHHFDYRYINVSFYMVAVCCAIMMTIMLINYTQKYTKI